MKGSKKVQLFTESVVNGVYKCGYSEFTQEQINAMIKAEKEQNKTTKSKTSKV